MSATIERDSPVPLYHQLRLILEARIESGEFAPGERLPTEDQLQQEYNISRTTVRQALGDLVQAERVTRHRGRGTIVSPPKITHGQAPHLSLASSLRRQGVVPGWRLLAEEWITAPAEIATRLGREPGERLFRLRRLRLADEEPIGLHVAHAAVAPGALDRAALTAGGSLDYLANEPRLEGSRAHRTLEAIAAAGDVAGLLGIRAGSPLLRIARTVIGRDGRPLELLDALYRGDRLQYHLPRGPEIKGTGTTR